MMHSIALQHPRLLDAISLKELARTCKGTLRAGCPELHGSVRGVLRSWTVERGIGAGRILVHFVQVAGVGELLAAGLLHILQCWLVVKAVGLNRRRACPGRSVSL